MRNEMNLQFSALSQNEALARVAIAAFVAQLDPTVEEISDIKTAVSEAVTNAIIHGYESDPEGTVYLSATIDNEIERIEIEIRDHGIGIADIDEARQPLYTSKPELERSGMGFTIMENFMDELAIQSQIGQGTSVKIVKFLSRNGSLVH